MRWTTFLTIPFIFLSFSCEEEEVPPPNPPTIDKATVSCKDEAGQDYKVVDKVTVQIIDQDRDLVVDSFVASVNGVPIKLGDGDVIDDIFEWSPPTAWDPKMVCRGDFRISVRASDATNLVTKTRLVVTK